METDLKQNNPTVSNSSRIILDVGGKIFHVSKSTLLKQDSFFSSMFGGKFGEPKMESDGSYFIGTQTSQHFYSISYH